MRNASFILKHVPPAPTYFPVPWAGTVSSALAGLTAGFGMEPGVSPPLWAPGNLQLNRSSSPQIGVQVERAISTARLHPLLSFHLRPIKVVVSHRPSGSPYLGVGFALRCFQRLSRSRVATRRCPWRDNRYTRACPVPVLSY